MMGWLFIRIMPNGAELWRCLDCRDLLYISSGERDFYFWWHKG